MNNFFLKTEPVIIIWELPSSTPIPTIVIYDLAGNTISSGNGTQIPGINPPLFYFNAGILAEGEYVYQITWESEIQQGSFSVKDISTTSGVGGYQLNITVKDNNPIPNIIPYAFVYIYSNTNIFITFKMADVNGFADFALPGGTYKIKGFKQGFSFDTVTQVLVADTNLDFIGIPLIYTPAPDPSLCRIHVNLIDFEIVPVENINVDVDIVTLPQITSDKLLTWTKKTFMTNINGYTYFDVIRKSKIRVKILPARLDVEINVPDTNSAILADLISK